MRWVWVRAPHVQIQIPGICERISVRGKIVAMMLQDVLLEEHREYIVGDL